MPSQAGSDSIQAKEKNQPVHRSRQHRLNAKSENQPSSIASTGQFSAQVPQSTQMSGLITYLSSPSEIASTGQLSAQEPQLTQASVIL